MNRMIGINDIDYSRSRHNILHHKSMRMMKLHFDLSLNRFFFNSFNKYWHYYTKHILIDRHDSYRLIDNFQQRILQCKPHLITNNHYYIFDMYLHLNMINTLLNIISKRHFVNNILSCKPMNNYRMSKITLKYMRCIMNLMDLSSVNKLDRMFSILLMNLSRFIMGNFHRRNFN